ncbi:hypothetical protein C8J56DRAFT_980401 [Mycena floridula]|nr:hypothetical protein C8J56DRAFT_980401 [Mycena floridula]
MFRFISIVALFCAATVVLVEATPYRPYRLPFSEIALKPRTEPSFPDSPPSCPICAASYDNINSCATAAPVLANFTQIIFNPGAFIDIIQCACTDTFQSAYPQCVDCFQQTGQTEFLGTGVDLPQVIVGIQHICALESTLLGGVASSQASATATGTAVVTTPTSAASKILSSSVLVTMVAALTSLLL